MKTIKKHEKDVNGLAENLAGHLADLERLRDSAEAAGKLSSAIQAEVARGRAAGLYVDKVQLSGNISMSSNLEEAWQRVVRGKNE